MKRLVSLILLVSYLLVVSASGISLLVSKPVAKAYVHSKDCQQKNYLMADCWDKCNGDQHITQAKNKQKKEAALILVLLDFHYHTQHAYIFHQERSEPEPVLLNEPPSHGFLSGTYLPPQSV